MRRVLEGGEGMMRGGRSERSSERGVVVRERGEGEEEPEQEPEAGGECVVAFVDIVGGLASWTCSSDDGWRNSEGKRVASSSLAMLSLDGKS